jgi:hypothetical protein
MDRYDSEIAYADKVVGKVIAMLAKKRPGAIVIVAADHGEEFGEHGGRYHGTTLYEEQTHVPFLVVVPGLTPHVVAGPTQLIDIPSTVLGLLDLPVPARMRGTDLGPWLASPAAPVERLPPAFAEVEDKRMVVVGTEKLICNVSRDYCSYFDLAEDAREEHDRADARPERVAILRAKLNAWLEEQARFETKLLGAAGSQGSEARLIERGRLGEASAALGLAAMLLGNAPVASRREAASLLVTALPPQAQTQTALLAAANGASDSETRAWAAIAAMRAGADTMKARVRALLAGQAAEQGSALCVYAALALAESADSAGCAVLTTALDTCDSDVSLCKRILAALGKLGDTCAVPGLVAHLPFVQTRRETVLALAAIPDPTSVAPLVECLKEDTYVPVRVAAALALGHLGGARAVQALEWSIKHESEAAVLAAVRQALGALGRR